MSRRGVEPAGITACIFDDCETLSNYNFEGEKKSIYCKKHKLEDMIDVNHNFCIFESCKIRPSYNFINEKKLLYCKEHKLEGMVDVVSDTCIFNDCETIPCYNFEGENRAIYCRKHILEGMIDIKSKTCKTYLCQTKITKKYDFSKSITHLDDGYNETTYKNNNFLDYSYRKFHENGQLKESGFYDLKSVTDTIDIYYSPIPIFDDGIKAIQVTKEAVKHGVWLFYNRKGKIIKREIYYYGELVKN
jgi:antitoxin component YwqK of YwqJK toxin-antitoxin module